MNGIRKFFKAIFKSIEAVFIWSSGVNPDIIDLYPTERSKYYGIGGTIVFTALMATFAGGYAFFTAFKSVLLSVFFGLFWGALIFNLDRYIVSTFGSGDGKRTISWQEIYEAAPRILMAIILGFVISTPLELKLFEKEINAEIKRQNLITEQELNTDAADNTKKLNSYYLSEIKTLRSNVELRTNELKTAKKKRDDAYDKYMCELNGTCGTGVPGDGPVFEEAKANYNVLNKEYRELVQDYNRLNKSDNETILDYQKIMNSNLEKSKSKVAKLQTDYASRNGLLARLDALGTITSNNLTLSVAKWMITLLLIFIEIAPILFKMMTERGPYDDHIDRLKHEVKVRQLLAQSNTNQEVNTEVRLHNDKMENKLNAELLANKELLTSIAQAQAEIAKEAVKKWKSEQIQRVKSGENIVNPR